MPPYLELSEELEDDFGTDRKLSASSLDWCHSRPVRRIKIENDVIESRSENQIKTQDKKIDKIRKSQKRLK